MSGSGGSVEGRVEGGRVSRSGRRESERVGRESEWEGGESEWESGEGGSGKRER